MINFDKIIDRSATNAYKLDLCEKIFGTSDLIPLWVADMDFPAPDAVVKAVEERAKHPIYGYTIRPESFYQSIVNWNKTQHQWDIHAEWIEFTPGVVPALVMAIEAFTNPGDKVVIQTPVYYPFYSVVNDNKRQLVKNSLVENDGYYTIDFDHFESVIKQPDVKLFILCNPHNPVGRAWNETELRRMAEICIQNNITIISDEIHSDLCFFGNKHIPLASLSEEIANQTITLMAPSKTFNIAGFSTSYMIASNKELLLTMKKKLFGLQMHMGNIFGYTALEAAYNHGGEWLKALRPYLEENINLVDEFVKSNFNIIKFRKPEATYLLWLDFRQMGLSQADLKTFLTQKAKLGLNDGTSFGVEGEGFMRMNVASPKSTIKKALLQLEAVL